MLILCGQISLTADDRLKGLQIINCSISCDFDIEEKGYSRDTRIFVMTPHLEGKTEQYKLVFEGVEKMQGCIIKGAD